MAGGIYLVQGDDLVPMTEQPYNSEEILQQLLARHPQLLAGDQDDRAAPRRWLLVTREMPVPGAQDAGGRWSLDHLFLDQDGIPTLVEVKRSTDTRIRREVVGQMLDYAANAVLYWPIEAIRSRFEATCEAEARDPEDAMLDLLGVEEDEEGFWQRVKTNLQAGRIRLVFLADVIPPELQCIVEYLNGQMDPTEVLAIEVRQYVGQGQRAVAPRILGQTADAERKKAGHARGGASSSTTEAEFFADLLDRQGADAVDVVRSIQSWARSRMPREAWGVRSRGKTYWPCIDATIGGRTYPFFPLAFRADGTVQVDLHSLLRKPGFEADARRLEFVRRLNTVPGVQIREDRLGARLEFPLMVLQDEAARDQLIRVLDWFVDEVRSIADSAEAHTNA